MTTDVKPDSYSIKIDSPDGARLNILSPWAIETAKAEEIASTFWLHRKMMDSATGSSGAAPLVYRRLRRSEFPESSSKSMPEVALEYYKQIENRLTHLASPSTDRVEVEAEAARTALVVLDELKRHQIAPPEISIHGGDAVVMLWAIAQRTFAITVTEGELGYVVRENRKAVKMEDSLLLQQFRLEHLF